MQPRGGTGIGLSFLALLNTVRLNSAPMPIKSTAQRMIRRRLGTAAVSDTLINRRLVDYRAPNTGTYTRRSLLAYSGGRAGESAGEGYSGDENAHQFVRRNARIDSRARATNRPSSFVTFSGLHEIDPVPVGAGMGFAAALRLTQKPHPVGNPLVGELVSRGRGKPTIWKPASVDRMVPFTGAAARSGRFA